MLELRERDKTLRQDFGAARDLDETRKENDFKNKSTDGSEFRKKQKPDNDLKMFETK